MADERSRITPGRPVIAITQGRRRRQAGWWLLCLAVWIAGGRPRLVMTGRASEDADFDGLIIAGGIDVHPGRYGGVVKPGYAYDEGRDAMEIACFERALATGRPVLGVCRGAQLMNVARGGTLCFDVSKAYEKAEYPSGWVARIFYRKAMRATERSTIARLLGCRRCKVNSMHTQSVAKVGEGFTVTAAEENGVVQTIEDETRAFVLGVQFHPEYLIHRTRFRRLFRELVRQAASGRTDGSQAALAVGR